MRGSPLLRAAIMVAALLALLIPLRSLTSARSVPVTMNPEPTAQNVTTHLVLTCTAAPFHYEVSHLGKVIWQGESTAETAASDVAMTIPKEGVDLALKASWTAGQTAAVKLAVSTGEDDPIERTIWGEGSAEDVLTFP